MLKENPDLYSDRAAAAEIAEDQKEAIDVHKSRNEWDKAELAYTNELKKLGEDDFRKMVIGEVMQKYKGKAPESVTISINGELYFFTMPQGTGGATLEKANEAERKAA